MALFVWVVFLFVGVECYHSHEIPIEAATRCSNENESRDSSIANDFWEGIPGQGNITKVTENTFAEFTKQRSWVFVYNDWCPTFKNARESIAKIASSLKEINYPGGLGAFQCRGTRNDTPTCEKYDKGCRHYNLYFFGGNLIEPYPYATINYESHAVNFMKRHISKPDEKVYPDRRC